MIETVTVIGAGTMGRSITQYFLQRNVNVLFVEEDESVMKDAISSIERQIEELEEKDFISTRKDDCISNLKTIQTLTGEISTDLVIEAIPEKMPLKQKIFAELEEKCNNTTIFATNTSGLSISEIASVLKHPERLIGTHFFTPAAIVPLVEVVKGEKTSEIVTNFVMDGLEELGKRPVLLKKEIPGFIGNRLQHAISREAISLLESGVASAEDIDTVVKWSIGLRMVLTGPIEQRDINGLNVHYDIASYLYKDLNNSSAPSPLLKEKIDKGETGLKEKKGFYDWDKVDYKNSIKEKDEKLLELIQLISQNKTRGD
ncbi:3-hydroxyacyl-CoA dehydrogenase family protein [Virgibacillus sp. NKC19-3]|uniref:3-hydroxyacyl-CoA dehydrogenase NAD-binding domain-containing protein n=1 Tax=Virgibacillus saliphilus TaxID=2831674 RepID=UPI001C9BB2AD|nr:3-hydroxyacyl-CoA dehydrogenase NAD-binding domain-containing protein [Virgibacillus sp. NKC19-3]MBY7144539.1 3-hydroxyacyl-CoA dehydrogenase family protein [Virgibacillus sp. NKC19-3]